jgi:hypothetical protein
MLTPTEPLFALKMSMLSGGREFMLEIDDENSAGDDEAAGAAVEEDGLEGEGKNGGNVVEERQEIRHAPGDHSANAEVN